MNILPEDIDYKAVASKEESEILSLIENLVQNGMLWEKEYLVVSTLRKYQVRKPSVFEIDMKDRYEVNPS